MLPVLAILLGAMAPGASRAETVDDGRAQAITLAREGRCEPALEALARVQRARPADAVVARLHGECALRLQDFRLAIESLELARSLDEGAEDVDLHLGMAYYHAGRIDEAHAALVRAGGSDGREPEFLLYSGLVAYAQTDYSAASGRLTAASGLGAGRVEPMASFFLGRASLGLEDERVAREAFERVERDFPGTLWAEEAERALAAMDEDAIGWWASAEVGFEHDDNPLLRGTGVGLPSEIAGQSDQRFYWFVDAGAILFDRAGWQGGGMLRYGGSEHLELERFDTHAPGATLWVDRDLEVGDASLRLQYDFDVALIDYQGPADKPFVISHLVGASIYKPWQDGIYTIVGARVGRDHYGYDRSNFLPEDGSVGGPGTSCLTQSFEFCGPGNLNEADATDRDGTGVGLSLLQHFPLPLPSDFEGLTAPWIEGEYLYQRYWSEGSEYDHQRHQIEIGFGVLLPFEIGLRVSGRYAYLPYGNPSVFPDPSDVAAATARPPNPPDPGQDALEYFLDHSSRREHETGVRVSLERALGEHVVLTTRYSRSRNRSTSDVFSYTRDLFGISIRVALGG